MYIVGQSELPSLNPDGALLSLILHKYATEMGKDGFCGPHRTADDDLLFYISRSPNIWKIVGEWKFVLSPRQSRTNLKQRKNRMRKSMLITTNVDLKEKEQLRVIKLAP
ncbi:hypothetical protein WA026_007944 [Henosepilachna vigintioctopunctata]|uniref:Uncharacterized protein n=1 Tax=Henosepilachna vigintioctopunctata TaxID=420089 RepID=A0AAW1TPM5_9CUCU